MPEPKRRYIMPADVAEGLVDGNFSAAHILDIDTNEQVAVWHGKEEPYQFGRLLYNLGLFYNGALAAPERNNNGITCIDYLRANNYPMIYKMQKYDQVDAEDTVRLGWMTNLHTRPLIIDALKDAVRTQQLILNDPDTLAEMRTFVRNPKNGKIEAATGSFDDLVISLAIGCYIRRTQPLSYSRDESYADRIRARDRGASGLLVPGRGGY